MGKEVGERQKARMKEKREKEIKKERNRKFEKTLLKCHYTQTF